MFSVDTVFWRQEACLSCDKSASMVSSEDLLHPVVTPQNEGRITKAECVGLSLRLMYAEEPCHC